MKYYSLCFSSGFLWACVAYFTGHHAFESQIFIAMAVSPLIGLVVGYIFLPAYRWSRGSQFLWSLLTLYVAVTLFGLAIGIFDAVGYSDPNRPLPEVVFQAVLFTWLGTTLGGLFLVLWPLSYVNHRLVGRAALAPNQRMNADATPALRAKTNN